MSPLLGTVAVLAGLACLALGGEALVKGAVGIARRAGLSTAVIGLTVVAMGTSLPELVVSVIASLGGTPDIAIGNVVGSNIANVGLILGLSSVFFVLPIHGSAVRLEWPFMFAASWVTMLLVRDGVLDRLEGGFLFISLVLFMSFMVYAAKGSGHTGMEEQGEKVLTLSSSIIAVAIGVGLLVLGGKWLVDGAIVVARFLGVTERVIGLTVVAVGTSLPELATSLVAAYRRHADVAIANILGSNIFNLLGILGVTALVRPVPVAGSGILADFWWMLAISFLLFPFLWYRSNLARVEGVVLFGGWVVYVTLLFAG